MQKTAGTPAVAESASGDGDGAGARDADANTDADADADAEAVDGDGVGVDDAATRALSSRGDAKYRNARVRAALVMHANASANAKLTKAVLAALAEKLGIDTNGKAADVRARVDAELERRALQLPPAAGAGGASVADANDAVSGKAYGSSIITIPPDLFHGVTQRVRQSWFDAVAASAWRLWRVVDDEFLRTLLPPLTNAFMQYLFATPTVSLAPVHSATAARAVNFTDGAADLARSNVRACLDVSGRRVLLYNRCAASMSSGTLHYCFFSYALPDGSETTWARFRASYRAACSCKNGETTGNCGHLAALLRRLAQLQGNTPRTKMRVARAVATHANSAVLPRAWERASGTDSTKKSNKRPRERD
jgi:hypothetical protein